jgi:hypothetical protein
MAGLVFPQHLRAWVRVTITAISLLLLLAYGLPAVVPPAAARPQRSTPTLTWHGGPVQHHPRIYLLFWGPAWQSDPVQASAQSELVALFNSLAGGQYNNLLTQYGDHSGDPEPYVHNDVAVAGVWTDAQTTPAGLALASMPIKIELNAALAAHPCTAQRRQGPQQSGSTGPTGWCVTPDAQFMVLPQQGTRYSGDLAGGCGVHSSYRSGAYPSTKRIFFSVVRFPDTYPDVVCSSLDAAATHEYAETATDPWAEDPAWATNGTALFQRYGAEIADLCQQWGAQLYVTSGGVSGVQSFFVAPLWDNSTHTCATARGQEFWSPITGKHTVQGAILAAYQGADPTGEGGPGGPLGYPTSEAYPILGGWQAAFQHGTIIYESALKRTSLLLYDDVDSACRTLIHPFRSDC